MTYVKDFMDVTQDYKVDELAEIEVVNTLWEESKVYEALWVVYNEETKTMQIVIQEQLK